jgi:glyoxylase-like metal-dependent hydrolase (beta-lactamase superfamily II)
MWIQEPGPVTESIEFLGRPELCTYLLKGDIYTLVGGGMAHIVPDVLEQLENLDIDIERIRYLIILHTHYGVGASILKNKNALKAIQDYNNPFIEKDNGSHGIEQLNIVKEGFPVHYIFNERAEMDLGNKIKFYMFDSPGHSVCSQALYVPKEYALFPSDSMGVLTEEKIMPVGSSNYDQFQKSIEKLSKIGAENICLDHFGALIPPDGKGFFNKAKKSAGEFREKMIYIYKKTKDIDETVNELSVDFDCGLSEVGLLPENLMKDILKRMVMFVNRLG